MTSNQEFFEKQKQAAAVFKHAILANYVTVFSSMTSSRSDGNRVWYIDGYAGPGVYEPQPGEGRGAPGSPMLALGTARKLANFKTNPRDLRCVFIESDKNHATKLAAVMAKGAFAGFNYQVLPGTVEEHLDKVVEEVGSDPLLTFLDPFGTSLPWPQMAGSLLARPKNVANEVLLNLNLDSLRRIGGLLGRADLSVGDKKTLLRLDTFLGDDSWRGIFLTHYRVDAPGSATTAAVAVAAHFRERVFNETGYRSFTVPIRRNLDNEPIFLMTLFFTHSAAAFKFADAASCANRDWRKSLLEAEQRKDAKTYSNTLFGDDFSETMFEQMWKDREVALRAEWERIIAENICTLLERGQPVLVRDNVAAIYGTTLGLAREMHLRAAWKWLAGYDKASAPPTGPLGTATISPLKP